MRNHEHRRTVSVESGDRPAMRRGRWSTVGVWGGCLALVAAAGIWLAGCSVMLGPGGASASLKIGNGTFTIGLGSGGVFIVVPESLVRNLLDVRPFNRVPSDTPVSGSVRLRSSSVTVAASGGPGKEALAAQSSVSGTAHLRIRVDAPGSESACETGFEVGTFEVTVQNGVVTRVSDGLPLSHSGASYFYRNDLTLCLEMQADFAGTIRVDDLDIVFGPAEDLPDGEGFRGFFTLVNVSSGPAHILAPREESLEANRLGSGSSRRISVDNLRVGDLITFRTARDGSVLDSVTCPPVLQSGLEPIVEWNGVTMRCYYAIDTITDEPAPETEACCLPPLVGYELYGESGEGSCFDVGRAPFRTSSDCTFFGGVPQGLGTSCATTTCRESFSACCFGDSCVELRTSDCLALGGDAKGSGVHCTAFPCDTPDGPPDDAEEACCFDDGSCVDGFPDLCSDLGGTPQGPTSTCATTTCPQPIGACCLFDGSCVDLTEADCDDRGGTFDVSTVCSDADCPQPGYVVFRVINYPEPLGQYLTVQLAHRSEDPPLLSSFPGGGSDPEEPALLVAENAGLEFEFAADAVDSVCSRFSGFCDDPASVPTAIYDGAEYGVDRIFIERCARFQVFQITNYGSAGKGFLTVRMESQFCAPPLLSSLPGGGIDPNRRVEWQPLTGERFETNTEAAASICSRFSSFFRPPLASFIQQAYFDGTEWPQDTASVDNIFVSACPDVPR